MVNATTALTADIVQAPSELLQVHQADRSLGDDCKY